MKTVPDNPVLGFASSLIPGILSALAALLTLASTTRAATSLSIYDGTFVVRWQEDAPVGQFANGDYYIVADSGITVTGITPESVVGNTSLWKNKVLHGAMLNPIPGSFPRQGFDERFGNSECYQEALNFARQNGRPLSPTNSRRVPAGSSLCLSKSFTKEQPADHGLLADFAVVTILASAPPPGSLRPPYTGTDKTVRWNKADLRYDILRNLDRIATMAAPKAAAFTRPWTFISTNYNWARDYRARNNQPEYEREAGYRVAEAWLELLQNYPNESKETAYIRLVQAGIDAYGAVKYGRDTERGVDYPNFEESQFPKGLVVFAAAALNDDDIKIYANAGNKVVLAPFMGTGTRPVSRFNLDGASNYVTADAVDHATRDQFLTEGRMRLTYTAQMIGLPEWGFEADGFGLPEQGSNFSTIYRDVRYSSNSGIVLAARLTNGGREIWNHPALFDWIDRAYTTYRHGPAEADRTTDYVRNAWTAWRALGGPVWKQAPPIAGLGWVAPPQRHYKTNAVLDHTGPRRLNLELTDNATWGKGGIVNPVVTSSSGAPVTATYRSGAGGTSLCFDLSRDIRPGETLTYSLVQNGDNLEAAVGGGDVPAVSGVKIVNYLSPEPSTGGHNASPPAPVASRPKTAIHVVGQ